jgi:hypothetical protein
MCILIVIIVDFLDAFDHSLYLKYFYKNNIFCYDLFYY